MKKKQTLPGHVRIFVIGAGFGGLGLAIKLRERGETDFLVIDKGADVGGTWRDNTYPGAACDVPSQLYSFSFAPNPHWSRSFSPQPEIQAYIQDVSEKAGVRDHFRFGVEFLDASWQDGHWAITTSAGSLTADFVVSAAGGLSEPKMPDIDGIDSFAGDVMHSARWDHSIDLEGKRVAVIGTGASAIQIIPEVAKVAGHLDVYQRTAPWVMKRKDRAYLPLEKFAFKHVPIVQKAYRTAIYWGRECFVPAFTLAPQLALPAKLDALDNIKRSIEDPEMRKALTPDYDMGCKRILISNTYYPALAQDNVELVTDGIAKVTGNAVVTTDGVEREIDVLIVATGFHTTDLPIAHHVVGRDGRTMAEQFEAESMSAYKGTTIHNFPNLFQIVGPNTGLGHSSMVFMIESQLAYILGALDEIEKRGVSTFEVKREAQQAWTDDIQKRMAKTVWSSGGCASWYLDAHGKNVTLWPRTTFAFRLALARFDIDQYDVEVTA
ncbi:MAG TPA: NAD(P)/FAD-dependent oxidoreductase [Nocardioidaceae bacterium]|nr:NAD(P)/FAD-dependent oxidoreductase [Nocardioidaceae bacterium]